MPKLPFEFRFSLGEALLLVLFAGIGLAALRMGDWVAAPTLLLALVAVIAIAVVAVSAEGAARRFAVCFLIGATIYGLAVWRLGASEFDPATGVSLSTRAMEPVYAAMAERSFYDMQTGLPPTSAERKVATESSVTTLLSTEGALPAVVVNGRIFRVGEHPARDDFMRTAHVLWALLIGYAAGKLGAAIYRQRIEGAEQPSEPSAEERRSGA